MIFSGLMIPFLGTTLGAGMVFFMKGSMNQKLEKMLLGFAAGVMIQLRCGRFLYLQLR